MAATRDDVGAFFDALLQPERFRDYGPNGLQVEGRAGLSKRVSGVTASLAPIDAAIGRGADAIFVHHGLFWRSHDGRLTGWLKARVQRLLAHDVSPYAYHLLLGHHATERYGAPAVAAHGAERFGFEREFIDIDDPA